MQHLPTLVPNIECVIMDHSWTSPLLLLIGLALLFYFSMKRWAYNNRKDVPLVVLLVRHCQSTANVDASVYESMPDHAIPLSDLGIKTTIELGTNLSHYLKQRFGNVWCGGKVEDIARRKKRVKCKLLVSPFRRTRETASLLLKTDLQAWVTEVEESCFLCEQDWGLFEGTGLVKGNRREHGDIVFACKHQGLTYNNHNDPFQFVTRPLVVSAGV